MKDCSGITDVKQSLRARIAGVVAIPHAALDADVSRRGVGVGEQVVIGLLRGAVG
jgi:hypothetical protein